MEFKGCTVASNEDIVNAVHNYKLKDESVNSSIRKAKSDYLKANKGKTVKCGIFNLKTRLATKDEIFYFDVSYYDEYPNLIIKLLDLSYLEDTPELRELRDFDSYHVYLIFSDTAVLLEKLQKSGSEVYVTPEQADFIARFK